MPQISSLYVFVSFSCHLKQHYAIQKIHRDVIFSSARSAAPHACSVVGNRSPHSSFWRRCRCSGCLSGNPGSGKSQGMAGYGDGDGLSHTEICLRSGFSATLLVKICSCEMIFFKKTTIQLAVKEKRKRKTLLDNLISHTFLKIQLPFDWFSGNCYQVIGGFQHIFFSLVKHNIKLEKESGHYKQLQVSFFLFLFFQSVITEGFVAAIILLGSLPT